MTKIPIDATEVTRFRREVLPFVGDAPALADETEHWLRVVEATGVLDETTYADWCKRFVAHGESLFTALFHDGLHAHPAEMLRGLLDRYPRQELQRPVLRALVHRLVTTGDSDAAMMQLRDDRTRSLVRTEPLNKRRELRNRLRAAGLPRAFEAELDELLELDPRNTK